MSCSSEGPLGPSLFSWWCAQHGHDREVRSYLVGWKQILPSHGNARHPPRSRRMDPPSPAARPTQAVEAGNDGFSRATRARSLQARDGRPLRRPLVEGVESPDTPDRPAHKLLRPDRSPEACRLTSTTRTAGCGPACPVVWEGRSRGRPAPLSRSPSMGASRESVVKGTPIRAPGFSGQRVASFRLAGVVVVTASGSRLPVCDGRRFSVATAGAYVVDRRAHVCCP